MLTCAYIPHHRASFNSGIRFLVGGISFPSLLSSHDDSDRMKEQLSIVHNHLPLHAAEDKVMLLLLNNSRA